MIDDPRKQEKHSRSFTIYMGAAAVYPVTFAKDLMAALEEIAKDKDIYVQMVDTDPNKNPQPPADLTNMAVGKIGGKGGGS